MATFSDANLDEIATVTTEEGTEEMEVEGARGEGAVAGGAGEGVGQQQGGAAGGELEPEPNKPRRESAQEHDVANLSGYADAVRANVVAPEPSGLESVTRDQWLTLHLYTDIKDGDFTMSSQEKFFYV